MTAEGAANRAAALAALRERAAACVACPLRSSCAGVVVPEGQASASLLIVGEAPGPYEDRAGHPLAGPAGALLGRALEAAGIVPENVCQTNLVQCRPPGDRSPAPGEAQTCTALWLRPLVALLRPRVVLTLGNAPTQFLLGTGRGMGELRGRWFPFPYAAEDRPGEALLMPLYHPAYLLRHESRASGGPRSLTWRDVREVAAVLRGDKEPEGLRPNPPVAVDDQPLLF